MSRRDLVDVMLLLWIWALHVAVICGATVAGEAKRHSDLTQRLADTEIDRLRGR